MNSKIILIDCDYFLASEIASITREGEVMTVALRAAENGFEYEFKNKDEAEFQTKKAASAWGDALRS